MNQYTEAKYGKTVGRVKFKNFFKKMAGAEIDEEDEKRKLREKYIMKNLTKEQRRLLKEELRDAKKKAFDDKMREQPLFNIASKFIGKKNGTCKCQILRSSCNWSTGVRIPEKSILNAYIDLILNSEKFIYIENQFFMSNAGEGGVVKNTIAKAMKERIIRAYRHKEDFKIYVFIPLMPGFEGDIVDDSSQVLKLQIRFQQETILKGATSLYTMLKNANINPLQYLRFYGLRNHDMFSDGPKQEMVYIHSKCMIVDDRVVIVGSANINDRSMLGTRDSEVCILVQDEEMVESEMGGKPFEVGKVPHEFRKRLMGGKFLLFF